MSGEQCPKCGKPLLGAGKYQVCEGTLDGVVRVVFGELQIQRDDAIAALARAEQALAESKTEVKELSEWVYRLETSGPHAKLADDVKNAMSTLRNMGQPNSGEDWLRLTMAIALLDCVHEALAAATGQQPAATTQPAQEASRE